MKRLALIFFIALMSAKGIAESSTILKVTKIPVTVSEAAELGIEIETTQNGMDYEVTVTAPQIIDGSDYFGTHISLYQGADKVTGFYAMDSEEYDEQVNETGNIEAEFYFHKNHVTEYEVSVGYEFLKSYIIRIKL